VPHNSFTVPPARLRRELGPGTADGTEVEPLVYCSSYGGKSFNLDVGERLKCMTAIVEGESFDPTYSSESARNLRNRYGDIESRLPEKFGRDGPLPFFKDWLLHRVIMVEITVSDSDMALETFETMNHRGLRLSNVCVPRMLVRSSPVGVGVILGVSR
jgi:hypothetical protein